MKYSQGRPESIGKRSKGYRKLESLSMITFDSLSASLNKVVIIPGMVYLEFTLESFTHGSHRMFLLDVTANLSQSFP